MVLNVVEMAFRGYSLNKMAKKLNRGGDRKSYWRWYGHLLAIEQDERFRAAIMARAEGAALRALPQALAGATRMSRRRMDAVKWIGEATGFHNPRVDHNVSGDIQITMNIPRPEREPVEGELVEEADVVE